MKGRCFPGTEAKMELSFARFDNPTPDARPRDFGGGGGGRERRDGRGPPQGTFILF